MALINWEKLSLKYQGDAESMMIREEDSFFGVVKNFNSIIWNKDKLIRNVKKEFILKILLILLKYYMIAFLFYHIMQIIVLE